MKKRKKIVLITLLLLLVLAILIAVLSTVIRESTSEETKAFTRSTHTEYIECIDDNIQALERRLSLINLAQKSIYISTFDYADDIAARHITAALYEAAERGVNIHIIVDGINGKNKLVKSAWFATLAFHPNVEAFFYNPVKIYKPAFANYRLHDKYFIIDTSAYILGGRNISSLFLGDYNVRQNIDRDVLVYTKTESKNNSLYEVLDYATQSINLKEAVPYSSPLKKSRLNQAVGQMKEHAASLRMLFPKAYNFNSLEAIFKCPDFTFYQASAVQLINNPIKAQRRAPIVWNTIISDMKNGKQVFVETPYIICSKDMYSDLDSVIAQGTEINFFINAYEKGANPFGCVDFINERKKMLQKGYRIYQCMESHSLHTKAFIIDEHISYVGSLNMDIRSVYLDTELMLRIESPDLNAHIRATCLERTKVSKLENIDGTVWYGENFPQVNFSFAKKLFYNVLRFCIKPFRTVL